MAVNAGNGDHEVERIAGAVVTYVSQGKHWYLLVKTNGGYRFPQRRIWPNEQMKTAAARAVRECAKVSQVTWFDAERFRTICHYIGWDPLSERNAPQTAVFFLGMLEEQEALSAAGEEFVCWADFDKAKELLGSTPLLETLYQADELLRGLDG